MNKFSGVHIKVFGTGTTTHQLTVAVLQEFLDLAQVPFVLEEVTDVSAFIEEGVASVPAVKFQDKIFILEHNGQFNNSLRRLVTAVLKSRDFGELKKILIPVDFSDVSTNAFMYGHRLATDMHAIVRALHVYYPTANDVKESDFAADYKAVRKEKFKSFIKQFDKDWGSDLIETALIDNEFKVGFAADVILETCKDYDLDLILLGNTGAGKNLKKWFGSVSTKVMEKARQPVLLVPEEARYRGINNIMYAYDDIDLDKKVMSQLIDFAKPFKAHIHLIHNNAVSQDPGYHLKELFEKQYSASKLSLANFEDEDIVMSLNSYAKENDIDIIAMAKKQRGFFESIFHGSITEKMALQASTPLLILK